MISDRPKGYIIKKRIDRPATIAGLFYNTFFVFVILAAIIFMVGSSNGITGFGIAALLISVCYFVLVYVQTKIGPKELNKFINNYNNPIDFIRMNKSIRRMKK